MDFEYDYLFKIVLIGDAGVGKTSLVKRFAQDNFWASEGPTIGVDFTIKTIQTAGKTVKVHVYIYENHDWGFPFANRCVWYI